MLPDVLKRFLPFAIRFDAHEGVWSSLEYSIVLGENGRNSQCPLASCAEVTSANTTDRRAIESDEGRSGR